MAIQKSDKNLKKKYEFSEIKFRTVAETASDAVIIADQNSIIIFSNSKVEEIFGYTEEELLGKNITIIMPEKYREAHQHGMSRFLKTGKPKLIGHTLELEGQKKDQRIFPIELSLSYWKEDESFFFTGIIRDISKRKNAEKELSVAQEELKRLNKKLETKVKERTKELKQRENQLSLITNTLPAFISYVDRNKTFLYTNDFYYNLNFINSSPTGKPLKEVFGEKLYAQIDKNLDKALGGEKVVYENEFILKDGSVKKFEISYLPDKNEEGHVNGLVVMAIDLTERMNYENDLNKKNEELKKINIDLDNFIYTASHDLKAPIANIEGLIGAINESDSFSKTSEDVQEMFNMVEISIEKFKHTLLDLTEISKAQRSQDEDIEEIDISEIIDDTQFVLKDMIKVSKAKVRIELKVPKIKFSKRNFRSIVYNLLSNAIKYRSPERVPEIEIKTEKSEEYILLSVKDNGLGIGENEKDKIFGMFQRVYTHVEGTGVGLYIIKRILDNSDGKIRVESKKGEGTTFKVYIKNE